MATNAAVDVDKLLKAIRQAGGAVVTVAKGIDQETGKAPIGSASGQQVSSPSVPQSPPAEEQSDGSTFPRFPELAGELRAMVWQQALNDPRLIYVHLGVPGSGASTNFDGFVMNRAYLTETDPYPSLFNASGESRQEVLLPTWDVSRTNWLGRLGLTQFHPNQLDLVYISGLRDGGRTPPLDINKIIPLSLVLGNVLPRVMVNGDIFVRYFSPDPDRQPEDPMAKALADLRALGSQYAPLFANDPAGLPRPRLPESMVFMLDNFPLKWDIVSPCDIPGHREEFIASCCIHYDHLEIIADSDMEEWMDANLVRHNDDTARDRANWRVRMEIVPAIRAIFTGWRNQPDVITHVPRLFFARVKPSH